MLTRPSEFCLVHRSPDLERTARFYRDVFGIVFEDRRDGADRLLFARLSPEFSISFMPGDPKPGDSPLFTFTLPEGGIDDVVAGLAEHGATIVTPVHDAPLGKGATLRDPHGHALGLYQDADKPLSLKGKSSPR
jgi:glyoxylase I family protein